MQSSRRTPDELLAKAHEAAATGHAAQAIAIARAVLDTAAQRGELRVIGQFRSAYEHAQRAVFLFEQVDDTLGECAALGTLAIAATHLAHHEDAVGTNACGTSTSDRCKVIRHLWQNSRPTSKSASNCFRGIRATSA